MNYQINRLIQFALNHQMIKEEDIDYSVNLLLDLFHLDSFKVEEVHEFLNVCTDILEKMLDFAVKENLIHDTITQRDLFDTRIMNCVMPRPSEVIETFQKLYEQSPVFSTDYFYALSLSSNYIRKSRTNKNISFRQYYKYAHIEITINLSKPEKDPQEIAKAKLIKSTGYPRCLLCKENVGFAGDFNHPPRQTHRIIPIDLDNQRYYIQYSPYVYYNEHCIVFHEKHQPMVINHDTFSHLLSFIEQFPHYMLGSNADLPIVGGSILSHDHFQGGRYSFPIEEAQVMKSYIFDKYPGLKIEILKWPLSTIRVTSSDKQMIIRFADDVLKKWKNYSLSSLDIVSHTQDVPHNTLTPIARMKNNQYQMDLVLRNNRTSEQYPDGIFHPHQDLHHIKKENIGLIEVMGLAILPARLKDELQSLKQCLLQEELIESFPELEKHRFWYEELKSCFDITRDNIDDILKDALTRKFVSVLEDCGVFKMNGEGIDAFMSFIESLNEKEEEYDSSC